jgi:hypothetical protein
MIRVIKEDLYQWSKCRQGLSELESNQKSMFLGQHDPKKHQQLQWEEYPSHF